MTLLKTLVSKFVTKKFITKKLVISLAFFSASIILSGCSLYRCDLQQGNYITQVELDKLEPNLSKNEVQNIMGSTVVSPMFLSDQWNYSYGYLDGKHRDQPIKFHTITLYFKHGKLTSYSSYFWKPTNLPKHESHN